MVVIESPFICLVVVLVMGTFDSGKLTKYNYILQNVKILPEPKLSGNNLEWKVKLEFYYKKPYLNFNRL